MGKVYTIAEIGEHNTRNDCWLGILGKVVDVTSFLDEHPGGDQVLLNATGKDATAEFNDVGHTHDAWAMLDKYCIGELDDSTILNKPPPPSLQPIHTNLKLSKYITLLLQFLIPLILLNLLLAFLS